MAETQQAITSARFYRAIRGALGLPITRPWLGYGDVLFLEAGKLHTEVMHLPKRRPLRVQRGQLTILMHSDWRMESRREFVIGSGSDRKKLDAGLKGFRGRRLTGFDLEGHLPELVVELDRTYWLRSFRAWGPPNWSIYLNDQDLFPREAHWSAYDHTVVVGTSEAGRLVRSVCYDPESKASRDL